MKKLFLAFLTIISLTFIGCVYSSREKLEFEDEKALHSETYERSFNDESYIWENFVFPTNKTESLGFK